MVTFQVKDKFAANSPNATRSVSLLLVIPPPFYTVVVSEEMKSSCSVVSD